MEETPLAPEVVDGWIDDALRRTWMAAVHEAARVGGLSLVEDSLTPPVPGRNYYRVIAEDGQGDRIRLLFNAAARLVAASRDANVPVNGPLEFCSVPAPEAFEHAGLRGADLAVLCAPLAPEHMARLNESQVNDVDYHRPTAVGDVLFNWFD